MSSIRPVEGSNVPISRRPEGQDAVTQVAASALAAGPTEGSASIQGAEDLSIQAISDFEGLLEAGRGDLVTAYEALPEALRYKLEELVYWHEVERRGSEAITDPQYGEHEVDRDIMVLCKLNLKEIFPDSRTSTLTDLIQLLEAPEKDVSAIRSAWGQLDRDVQNMIYGHVYRVGVVEKGKQQCLDRTGESFGKYYTKENLLLLNHQSPKFKTTLWKEAIIETAIATASTVNALQYRIPGKGLLNTDIRYGFADTITVSKVDTVCFLLSNGWFIGREYSLEKRTISQDVFNRSVQAAAFRGHLEVVRLLLSEGRTIPIEGHYGLGSAVRAAARGGALEVVQFLLSEGRTIPIEGDYGLGAAVRKAAGGHLEVVQFLLSEGRTIPVEGDYGLGAAVYEAARGGHLEVVRFLLSEGRTIPVEGMYSLGVVVYVAASSGYLEVVRFLLSEGRTIPVEAVYSLGVAVYVAASSGYLEVVRFLLSEGRTIPIEGHYGLGAAVRKAAEGGHLEVVQFLLSEGRTIPVEGDYGLGAAVRKAAEGGHLEVVRFLLSEGRHLTDADRDALILDSASRGRADVLEILLQQGPIREDLRDSARTNAAGPQAARIRDMLGVVQVIPRPVAAAGAPRAAMAPSADPSTFCTTFDQVRANPKECLQRFCAGREMPHRVFLTDNPMAVDLGGVTKQFISTLMGALNGPGILSLTEAGLPILEKDEHGVLDPALQTVYAQFGKFYSLLNARNQTRTDKFVTGSLFHPAFFAIVKIIAQGGTEEAVRTAVAEKVFEVVSDDPRAKLVAGRISEDERAGILGSIRMGTSCEEGEELAEAEKAIDAFVDAARAFHEGMTPDFRAKLRGSANPVDLARELQGEPASIGNLLAALRKGADLPEERFAWLQEKIRGSDENWRKRFVRVITGNEVLSPGVNIEIRKGWRAGAFEVHTCFNSLDIPQIEMTKEGFMAALDAVLVGEGYNIA